MFGSSATSVALSALFTLAAVQLARADPVPSEPAPGEVFTEGQTCHVAWSADTTGEWTAMNIELMTGPNDPMVHLTTVATVDATSVTTLDYTCPTVSLHSAIYFYQFSSASSSNLTWTGRFTITDSTGTTVDPPNSTVIDGATIKWGTGALTDASQYTAEPSYISDATAAIESASAESASSTGTASTSEAATTSSAAATTAATSTATANATGSVKKTASGTATTSGSAASSTQSKSASSNNASSESTSGAVEGRKVQVALGMVAVIGSVAAFI